MRSWKTRRGGAAAASRLAQDTRTHMHKYQVLLSQLHYESRDGDSPPLQLQLSPGQGSRTVIRI
jgi:hypothetical protein